MGLDPLGALTRRAAAVLGSDYDAEVIEMHHRFKKDAPSGTAARLLEIILEERKLTAEALRHGRSGITGKVNSRFGQRFGSAALISLLGAAPAVAAAKYTTEISSDTVENIGQDLSSAMSSAVEAYTSLPPIITVAPGAAITVMVDRDLEIW